MLVIFNAEIQFLYKEVILKESL